MRRALTPIFAVGVAYVAAVGGIIALARLLGDEYEPSDSLNRGFVFMVWSLIALGAAAVSVTSLAFGWRSTRWWIRFGAIALNVVVIALATGAFPLSVWSLQDYAASHAAYDTAVQVCGREPVIAYATFGGKRYIVPGQPDYDRQRFTTHDRFIFGGSVYFCTPADAEAHGYLPSK